MVVHNVSVTTPYGKTLPFVAAAADSRSVVWFDIDNCLYSKRLGIDRQMGVLIKAYFARLGLPLAEAERLHLEYYKSYGLAIRGLVRHHEVDPLEYDLACDAALDLDPIMHPNPALQELIASIDRSKYRVWALTNAYKNHAVRVLGLLGLQDQFEGVVSCDYGATDFSCKPELDFYKQAMLASGQPNPTSNYFVDDSAINIAGARKAGWRNVVHFDEESDGRDFLDSLLDTAPAQGNGDVKENGIKANGAKKEREVPVSSVADLSELREIWKEIFL